jgi:hypothetical protein
MPPVAIICSDREILEARLRADLKVYGDTVARLLLETSGDAFNKAYERAELARRAFRAAQKRLSAHLAKHRCEPVRSRKRR